MSLTTTKKRVQSWSSVNRKAMREKDGGRVKEKTSVGGRLERKAYGEWSGARRRKPMWDMNSVDREAICSPHQSIPPRLVPGLLCFPSDHTLSSLCPERTYQLWSVSGLTLPVLPIATQQHVNLTSSIHTPAPSKPISASSSHSAHSKMLR